MNIDIFFRGGIIVSKNYRKYGKGIPMKKYMRMLLAAALCACLLFAGAVPAEGEVTIVASGSCSENVKWQLDSAGELTISGTGEMLDYDDEDWDEFEAPWYSRRNSILKVTIENGVTDIRSFAFCDCSRLKSVSIPDSVECIDWGAFDGCSSLKSIAIPDSVTSIGDSAFWGCSSLKSIAIPEGVDLLSGSFGDCYSLETVSLPKTLEKLELDVFYNCGSLKDVYYAGTKAEWENVEIELAEDGADYLFAATIHCSDGDTSYKMDPWFDWRIKLPENALRLPADVTEIQKEAFMNSTAEYIVLPDGCKTIGSRAFAGWEGTDSEWVYIYIPRSVTKIADDAFEDSQWFAIICEPTSYAHYFAADYEAYYYDEEYDDYYSCMKYCFSSAIID